MPPSAMNGDSYPTSPVASTLKMPDFASIDADYMSRKSLDIAARFSARSQVQAILHKIGLGEYLHLDHRPTFILDITSNLQLAGRKLAPIWCNPALQKDLALLDFILGTFKATEGIAPSQNYANFQEWATEGALRHDAATTSFLYKGHLWAASTIHQGKWRIVSGTSHNDMHNSDGPRSTPQKRGSLASFASKMTCRNKMAKPNRLLPVTAPEYRPTSSDSLAPLERVLSGSAFSTDKTHVEPPEPVQSSFDWTSQDIETLSPHAQLLRKVDWANTPLGPIEYWNAQLRLAANLILADSSPALLLWGPESIMLYNEPYIKLIEPYHPHCLGTSVFTSLREYNDHTIPVVTYVRRTGEAVNQKEIPLFLIKDGRLEEGFYDLTFFPMIGSDGEVEGIYEQIRDTTKTEIMKRRLGAFMEFSRQTTRARSLGDFWNIVVQGLQIHERDLPLALLYNIIGGEQVLPHQQSLCSASTTFGKRAFLQAAIGVSEGHKFAPVSLSLEESDSGLMPYFREVLRTRNKMIVHTSDEGFPKKLLEGIKWRGFGEPCETFVISPIAPNRCDAVLGFFVVGINPRRPLDIPYEKWIQVMTTVISTSMASVVLLEEEVGRRQTIVEENAHAQAVMAQQLELKQRRIEIQERRFQRVAHRADIALFIVKPDGEFTFRNECWYDIFRMAKDEHIIAKAWAKLVSPEDLIHTERAWKKLSVDKEQVSYELRLKRIVKPKVVSADDVSINLDDCRVWIICSAYPELNDDGSVKEIVGCVTNITEQKWAERTQKQRAKDAVESKRALENFIDTTSHEMRNPLSAITQTADGLLSSALRIVGTYGAVEDIPKERKELMQIVIESAQTIIQCSNHQKRIVDDVLTMSKLDSDLLTIFPVDAQPENEIRHALRVFEGEARESKVEIKFSVDESYKTAGVDWVMLDPTRLIQVFINLLTNAIKFTRLEQTRVVSVSMSASETLPYSAHGARYFEPQTAAAHDPTTAPEWGQGEPFYLTVTVEDTGRGLTPEEKNLLFIRFSQASPKTHVTYGGSGLGLYISRRLAEMQGGAIGFDSTLGKGSTFSFYIKVRRSLNQSPRSRLPYAGDFDLRDAHALEKLPELLRRASSSSDVAQLNEQLTTMSPPPQERKQRQLTRHVSYIPDVFHVLVVEDNLVNQRVLAKQLRNHGCIVDVANHGVEALEHIEKTKFFESNSTTPTAEKGMENATMDGAADGVHREADFSRPPERGQDLRRTQTAPNRSTQGPACSSGAQIDPSTLKDLTVILMDWEMPVMDGLTCVRRIRELQRLGLINRHVPVIAVTANARQEQIDTAMKAGFDDLCTKPFRVPDLLARMRGVLERLEKEAAKEGEMQGGDGQEEEDTTMDESHEQPEEDITTTGVESNVLARGIEDGPEDGLEMIPSRGARFSLPSRS